MARPRKYPEGQEPGAAERSASYVERLREAGGKRRAYNWRPAVVEALDTLKEVPRFRLQNETEIISTLLIEASVAELSTPKRRTRRKSPATQNDVG